MAGSKTYNCWTNMTQRCLNKNNPNYTDYGGKGISICERWLKFENFLADMGERPSIEHSIDRKNNSKGYEPENCRWATQIEQQNNKRSNRLLTFNGKVQTMAEWSRDTGIKYQIIQNRIHLGWTHEEALTTPIKAQP